MAEFNFLSPISLKRFILSIVLVNDCRIYESDLPYKRFSQRTQMILDVVLETIIGTSCIQDSKVFVEHEGANLF